jgi:hypothetical protein
MIGLRTRKVNAMVAGSEYPATEGGPVLEREIACTEVLTSASRLTLNREFRRT